MLYLSDNEAKPDNNFFTIFTKKKTCSQFVKPGKTLPLLSVANKVLNKWETKFFPNKRHETLYIKKTKTNLNKVYVVMPRHMEPGMVLHTCNPSGLGARAGKPEALTILNYGTHSMTAWNLSQKKQKPPRSHISLQIPKEHK